MERPKAKLKRGDDDDSFGWGSDESFPGDALADVKIEDEENSNTGGTQPVSILANQFAVEVNDGQGVSIDTAICVDSPKKDSPREQDETASKKKKKKSAVKRRVTLSPGLGDVNHDSRLVPSQKNSGRESSETLQPFVPVNEDDVSDAKWFSLFASECLNTRASDIGKRTDAESVVVDRMLEVYQYTTLSAGRKNAIVSRRNCKTEGCNVQIRIIRTDGGLVLQQTGCHLHLPPRHDTLPDFTTQHSLGKKRKVQSPPRLPKFLGRKKSPPRSPSIPNVARLPMNESHEQTTQAQQAARGRHAAQHAARLETPGRYFASNVATSNALKDLAKDLANAQSTKKTKGPLTYMPNKIKRAAESVRTAHYELKLEHYPFGDQVCDCVVSGRYAQCPRKHKPKAKCNRGSYNLKHVGEKFIADLIFQYLDDGYIQRNFRQYL